MKRLFVLFAILSMLFTSHLLANEDPYQDWVWLNGIWVYVGDGDPGDPPPLPPIKR